VSIGLLDMGWWKARMLGSRSNPGKRFVLMPPIY
jgi:hypothetical protein